MGIIKMLNRQQLSRRERQIIDIIYQLNQATVAEVKDNLPNPPSYSAVRAMLNILEDKGYLKHEQDGPRYVYRPTIDPQKAKRGALKHLLNTIFQGSAENAVATLLDISKSKLTRDELNRLSKLIEDAKDEC